MGDAQGRTWGPKYSLRKAVNRLTHPLKAAKNAHNTGFLPPAEPAPTAADPRQGQKSGVGRLRLSVCLFGTTHWLTTTWRELRGSRATGSGPNSSMLARV